MKAGIHPKYVEATVSCACGNSFTTKSTRPQMRTDLCNVCHPFYTGEQRIVDSAGQVERFMKRMEAAQATAGRPSKRKQRIATRVADREAQRRSDDASPLAELDDEATPDTQVAARADGPRGAAAPTIPTPIQPAAAEAGVAVGTDERRGEVS